MSDFNVSSARSHFPALQQDHQVYFDNAGGSQVLGSVATSVKDYLEETNVQLGATYNVAKQSTESYGRGQTAAAKFMGAEDEEVGTLPPPVPLPLYVARTHPMYLVVIGPSTTQLFSNLSQILNLPPNSELILSSLDHEANTSAWVRLAKLQNHKIIWWPALPTKETAPPTAPKLTPENLRPLLSEKTAAIAAEVHKIPGAKLCVDGVALAPHREVDVKALGVDFYAFSWYKVYGPHIAILYASRAAQEGLGSLGHYFHTGTDLSTKLGLASASYELVAAIPQIVEYFGPDKSKTWQAIAEHEQKLQDILLGYLRKKEDVTIWGEESADKAKRVPVVSFTVKAKSSKAVVEAIESKSNFGCRWGHFYSKRMVDDLFGLEQQNGVIRVSMVHYNTEEEIRRYVDVLDEVLE
ncbi:hypothetical protein P7C71_g4146, partial [Lecanoromycetidae sp. Uapishka_2]